jgi:hypothetical protein
LDASLQIDPPAVSAWLQELENFGRVFVSEPALHRGVHHQGVVISGTPVGATTEVLSAAEASLGDGAPNLASTTVEEPGDIRVALGIDGCTYTGPTLVALRQMLASLSGPHLDSVIDAGGNTILHLQSLTSLSAG